MQGDSRWEGRGFESMHCVFDREKEWVPKCWKYSNIDGCVAQRTKSFKIYGKIFDFKPKFGATNWRDEKKAKLHFIKFFEAYTPQ